MKINDLIKFARDKNLGRKGLKKRVRDLKKSDYGKNWQVVDEDFYDHIGILQFDVNGVFKPSAKYPALADAIEVELVKCIGEDIAPMSDADRSKFANCLKEIGKATR